MQTTLAINDFINHLRDKLTVQEIKEKTYDGITYLKEKASNFTDNVACLRTRIQMFADMNKRRNTNGQYGKGIL